METVHLAVNSTIVCSWATLNAHDVAELSSLGDIEVKVGIISITRVNTTDFTVLIVTTSDEIGVTLGEGVTGNDNHTDEESSEEEAAQDIGAASVFHGSVGQFVVNWLTHVLLLVVRSVGDFIGRHK